MAYTRAMDQVVLEQRALGFPWVTIDPFLFCVYHDDAYPAGNAVLGPNAPLHGRNIGQDFEGKDGWRMYHGETVPGFPQHPHRGFETVTIVRKGYVDHSDSLGAAARFGAGDTQWLTAGDGIVHSEMFPLFDQEKANPLELFQIWLNLPGADKRVPPHFAMLWNHDIPTVATRDEQGKETRVTVVAGSLHNQHAPAPPPNSWAARVDTDVAIWCIRMEAGARYTLPKPRNPDAVRTLYFFAGDQVRIGSDEISAHAAIVVRSDVDIVLENTGSACELLMLQGRPIGEPVAAQGPFVMNTREELQQAFSDYRQTRFGGWPWPKDDPVHERQEGRFAKHADGRVERFDR